MKTSLKVVSIISIVFGALAILGSVSPVSAYGLIGGGMFAGQGIVALAYLGSENS